MGASDVSHRMWRIINGSRTIWLNTGFMCRQAAASPSGAGMVRILSQGSMRVILCPALNVPKVLNSDGLDDVLAALVKLEDGSAAWCGLPTHRDCRESGAAVPAKV